MIELADKWTRQPQRALGINRDSPLTAGLTRLTMPGIDFGRTRSGLFIPASLGAIPTAVGVAGNFNGSASLDVGPMDSSALTVMVGAIADSGSLKYLFGLEYNGAAEPLTLRINSGSLEFSVYEGGVVNDFVSVSAPSADTYNTFYGIAPPDGTTGTHEVGFFSQQGAKTSATKSIQVSARNGVEAFVGAGKGLGSPWRQYAKPIIWAATWKRQLTSAELAEVARNPWQLYAKRPKRIFVTTGGSSGVTGTAAVTLGNDTSSATGTTTVKGTAAPTLGNDTSSATGVVGSVSGTAAITLGNDTSSAQGTTSIGGTGAVTLGNDTCSASGAVGSAITGTAAITLGSDTSSATGTTKILGSSAIILGADFSTTQGTTKILGSAAIILGDDFATAFGTSGTPTTVSSPRGLTIRIGLAL